MAYQVVVLRTVTDYFDSQIIVKKIAFILLVLVLLPVLLLARHKRETPVDAVAQQPVATMLTPQQQQLFDSLYFEALSFQLLGKNEEALGRVNEALTINPHSAPALFFRSRQYSAQGKFVDALDDAWQAATIDTTNVWYVSESAQLWLRKGAVQKSIEQYESLHRQHPTNSQTLYHLADLYYRVDSLALLVDVLKEIEEIDGINPNIMMQKFYLLQQMGRLDEGLAEVEKVVARFPFDVQYRIQLGDLQMQNGMLQQAKKTYEDAARIAPDNAYVWVAQSNYYSVMGDQEAADALVNAALVHATLDIDTKTEILKEYLKDALQKVAKEKSLSQDTSAIVIPGVDELFTRVASMHPTAPEVYDLHASYLDVINQDTLAMAQERFAVDLRPSESAYWVRLLNYTLRAGDYALAAQYGREAIHFHPSEVSVYLSQAFAFRLLEMPDSVVSCYCAAIANIDPKEVNALSQVYGYLGDTYHEMGDKQQSYECYEQAIKLNERNYEVLNNYAYFITMDDKPDLQKAERFASKVVQQYPNNPTYIDTYAWIFYLQGNYMLAKFYQQRAIELAGDDISPELQEHWEKIVEAAEK